MTILTALILVIKEQDRLLDSVQEEMDRIYNNTRRFSNYYSNADYLFLSKGIHMYDQLGIVLDNDYKIPDLYDGISRLKDTYQIQNDIYTIAVINKGSINNYYGYFFPLRNHYSSFIYDDKFIKYEQALSNRKIDNSYRYFDSCDLVLTEEYREEQTNKKLRTILYPMYNKKKLKAVLMIDIKNSFFQKIGSSSYISNFLWSKEIGKKNKYHIFDSSITIPCSNNQFITFHFKLLNFILSTIFISLFSCLFYSFFYKILTQDIYRDHLTGLFRREYMKKITLKTKKYILFIDIDYFKNINDTYGHQIGDFVISDIASLIRNDLRIDDIAFRWGGEEFLIIISSIDDNSNLFNIAERIRKKVETTNIQNIAVTVSIGGYVGEKDFNSALSIADDMLYQSKNNGRNTVSIYM